MSTLRQQLVARRNGARGAPSGPGPVTPEGKRRSSLNAIRHGLLGNCLVLSAEDREAFDEIYAEFIAEFQPNDTELGMIEEMLAALWRQRRAWAIENRLFEDAIAEAPGRDALGRITAAFSTLAVQPQLELIHRYEVRLHRMFQRALNNLLRLRRHKDRRQTPAPAEKPVPNEIGMAALGHPSPWKSGACAAGRSALPCQSRQEKAADSVTGARLDPQTKLARLT